MARILEDTLVGDLVSGKQKVISVSSRGTLKDALKTMAAADITVLPVTAPHGRLAEVETTNGPSDYIGFLNLKDLLLHLAENLNDLEKSLEVPVAHVVGRSNESKSLLTLSPMATVMDALKIMSQGVHHVLVTSMGSNGLPLRKHYSLLSQSDIIRFLAANIDKLGPVMSRTVEELGLVDPLLPPLAISPTATIADALHLMHSRGGISCVAVVNTEDVGLPAVGEGSAVKAESTPFQRSSQDLQEHCCWAHGGRICGTLSKNDFRGLGVETLRDLPHMLVGEFLAKVSAQEGTGVAEPPVTCRPTAPLLEVLTEALECGVHCVWVTEDDAWLLGMVTYSDIMAAAHRSPSSFSGA